MELKLYSKKECPFCWQVKIALSYLQIQYERVEWEKPDKDFLLQYSPQGSSPVLLVNDFSIWDSNTIVCYLEDISANDKTLFPGTNNDKARARLLQTYNNTIAGKCLREVIFEKRSKAKSEWNMDRIKKGEKGWLDTLDWLELEIENNTSFLSAGFSIADAALLPRFGLAEHYGVGVSSRHPALLDWFQNLKEHNAYRETMVWNQNKSE